MAKSKIVICPYCGEPQPAGDRCRACTGLFEPLSRQVTQNDMGPWYIRNTFRPFQPGCSYETLVRLIERGVVTKLSIIRGPTTKQFWTVAKRVPGLSHLFGYCHNCDSLVDPSAHGCHKCGVPFGAYLDRNHLGLADIKLLPWEAPLVDNGIGTRAGSTSPVGISSFASDAELTGQATYAAAPAVMAASDNEPTIVTTDEASRMGRISSPMGVSQRAPVGDATLTEPIAGLSTMQAMQRQLEYQKRTTRNLMIGIGGISLVAIVLLFRIVSVSGGNAVNTSSAGSQPSQSNAGNMNTHDQGNTAGSANNSGAWNTSNAAIPGIAATSPIVHSPTVNSNTQSAVDDAANAHTASGDAEKLLSELQARYERAKDESLGLDSRITELQDVLEKLKPINPDDLAEDHRAAILSLDEDARKLLAQLKLKKFFP